MPYLISMGNMMNKLLKESEYYLYRWIISFVLKDNEPMTIYQKELDKIPPIECKNGQEKYFKIDVNGNLNTEQIDVKIKGLQ